MSRAAIVRSLPLVCATLLACGACQPDTVRPTPTTDQLAGDTSGGDSYVPWWLTDQDTGGDTLLPAGDTVGGDTIPSGDSYEPTLAQRVIGTWSGVIPWANNTETRILGAIFEAGGQVTYILNPWGPARYEYSGTYASEGCCRLVLTLPDLDSAPIVWEDVSVTGGQLDYTDSGATAISLTWGITPPTQGLIARLVVYDEADANRIETTSWGRFKFEGLLNFVHFFDPEPLCYDWVWGVEEFRLIGGVDFETGNIPGFDQHGGTFCPVSDRFAVAYFGSLDLPSGFTGLRYNVQTNNNVDDAGMAIVGEGVLDAINADPAVMCSAELGWLSPECYKHAGDYIGGEEILLDAGPEGGNFPFEMVFLEAEDDVYHYVEMDLGNTGSWTPIPHEIITSPQWWDE